MALSDRCDLMEIVMRCGHNRNEIYVTALWIALLISFDGMFEDGDVGNCNVGCFFLNGLYTWLREDGLHGEAS